MMLRPVSKEFPISSKFGERIHPVTGEKKMHYGVDFAAPTGTPVIACFDGEIIVAKDEKGFGNYILQRITYKNVPHFVFYCHLDSFLVDRNVNSSYPYEKVTAGQVIGLVGNTGLSSGPHLHFQVCKDDARVLNYKFNAVNPELLLTFANLYTP